MIEVHSITVVIDLNESDWKGCRKLLHSAFGKNVAVDIIYLDLLRKGSDGQNVVSDGIIIYRDDFNLFGRLRKDRSDNALKKGNDVLICLVEGMNVRVERLVRDCAARFKIGRTAIRGCQLDMLIQTPSGSTFSQKKLQGFLLTERTA